MSQSDNSDKYRVKRYGRSFQIVTENGVPLYDGAPYGNDKPMIFLDEDDADAVCARLNQEENESRECR